MTMKSVVIYYPQSRKWTQAHANHWSHVWVKKYSFRVRSLSMTNYAAVHYVHNRLRNQNEENKHIVVCTSHAEWIISESKTRRLMRHYIQRSCKRKRDSTPAQCEKKIWTGGASKKKKAAKYSFAHHTKEYSNRWYVQALLSVNRKLNTCPQNLCGEHMCFVLLQLECLPNDYHFAQRLFCWRFRN